MPVTTQSNFTETPAPSNYAVNDAQSVQQSIQRPYTTMMAHNGSAFLFVGPENAIKDRDGFLLTSSRDWAAAKVFRRSHPWGWNLSGDSSDT
jgi:hypothetical protein